MSTPYHSAPDRGKIIDLMRLIGGKIDPALVTMLMRQGQNFLEHVGSSAPRPDSISGRWQDDVIGREIPESASVLDLGCGAGELLCWLYKVRNARVQGIEIDPDLVVSCVERGVPVIQADLDFGLSGFPDCSFDYVILEETLQTLRRPDAVLKEMLRVGRKGIVTFPNFGCWRVRLDLAMRGKMPITEWLPHRWYDTPNIHLFSLLDFIEHAAELGMKISDIHVLDDREVRPAREGDNLYAEEALVIFEPVSDS